MSTHQKPSIKDICKIAFEANGFDFYQMERGFNDVFSIYRFMIIKYNPRSDKTQIILFYNIRSMSNYAFKKGYSSFNAFEISKSCHVFKKGEVYRDYYNGDRTKDATQLKYTIK